MSDDAIYEFDPNGVRTTFASGIGGSLALTARGNLFVADGASGVIYKFTPSGMRSTFASGLASVGSLTVDRAGNLFVADGISGILKFTPNGVRTTIASRVGGPMAVDGAGNLFVATQGLPHGRPVANTYTIYKFNSDGVRSTFASGYLSKTIGFFVSLGVDSSGNLYLVDAGDIYDGGGSAIYKFTRGGNRSTFFGPTPLWTGSSCNFGDLAIDSRGNVFVTDSCTGIDKITQDGNRTVFASGIEGSLAFQPPQGPSPTLLNISARGSVEGGENPLIAVSFSQAAIQSRSSLEASVLLLTASVCPHCRTPCWRFTLPTGNYTAILAGKNGETGVGLLELYKVAVATN